MMHRSGSGTRRTTLARVAPGDCVRICEILFDQLRSDCAHAGVRVGDVLMCRNASSFQVGLAGPDGRRVLLDQDWARWIVVQQGCAFTADRSGASHDPEGASNPRKEPPGPAGRVRR
jgi:hypothetical protein